MYQLEDGNTVALNNYLHNQDILEQQWELDLPNKQEAVVELAIKLIKQETTPELFNWVFSEYVDSDDINLFYDDLDDLVNGRVLTNYYIDDIVILALEGACMSLYDCELEEIEFHAQPNWVNMVLEGLNND